ncbi:hypothetical protein SAMN05421819_2303 [Bryocella elongata]|uniref:Uncharacterized protein n=1 Tax=Bryocella elongata TaxID=863522 RepID=A0A1H5YHX1_9BACT|nr:hypothetical protein [Bryocella elongata]SEG23215.1 hypothetical protein SAMN05421819_2303 [Bryocella elongata]
MQWSKLKSRIRSFITPELRDRIDFHVTSYRRSHDEAEKLWVTVDGSQVFIASWYQHQFAGAKRTSAGALARDGRGRLVRDPAIPASIRRAEELELHLPQDVGDSLSAYLDLSADEALRSSDPFVVALAMIDRRVGRGRLEKAKGRTGEHSLIRLFYELRMSAIAEA